MQNCPECAEHSSPRFRPLSRFGGLRLSSGPAAIRHLPGYSMLNWYGMLVPAGTPRAIITKLQAETARVLKLPDIRERLAAEGATVVGSTPEEFQVFLKEEIAKAARIVKASGMTASN